MVSPMSVHALEGLAPCAASAGTTATRSASVATSATLINRDRTILLLSGRVLIADVAWQAFLCGRLVFFLLGADVVDLTRVRYTQLVVIQSDDLVDVVAGLEGGAEVG